MMNKSRARRKMEREREREKEESLDSCLQRMTRDSTTQLELKEQMEKSTSSVDQ